MKQFFKAFIMIFMLNLLIISCSSTTNDGVNTDFCNNISCGEFGSCIVVEHKARCKCNEGYHADELSCIKDIDPNETGCTENNTQGLEGYFVSPEGSDEGDGSIENPISLTKALSNTSLVYQENKILWVCPGVYKGVFVSELSGTEESPFIIKAIPKTRVILDSKTNHEGRADTLRVNGSWTEYHGFEVMDSSTDSRESAERGSSPSDITLNGGVNIFGHDVKVINFVVHDTTGGFSFWRPATDSELYGNIIYNNGWTAPDRGHGHAIYTQNETGTKTLKDNIIFFGYGTGVHAYTEGGAIKGFDVIDNVWFHTGASDPRTSQRKDNCLIGGFQPVERLLIEGNVGWSKGRGTRIGYGGDINNIDATFRNNYLAESLWIWGNWETIDLIDTQVFGGIGDEDKAKITTMENSVLVNEKPTTGTKIFIKQNEYDANRARVAIFNWEEKDSIDVDLKSVLKTGDNFKINSVFDLFGEPVVKGTFDGNLISIPMGTVAPPQPYGMEGGIEEDDDPKKQFGVFIIIH